MPEESREPRSLIEAAERDAAAGDYAAAERRLREAAHRQESSLGPLHPDLANTLNNLGIVCELTSKPADAERCYRQAHAITTAVLPPDHPFAVTSRKNLTDFCEARGTAVYLPMALAAPMLPLPFKIVALSLCGLVSAMVMAASPWLGSNAQNDPAPASLASPPAERSAVRHVPAAPIAPANGVTAGSRTPAKGVSAGSRASAKGVSAVSRAPRTASGGRASAPSASTPTLVFAALCRNLSTGGSRSPAGDWRCEPAKPPVSGVLFFYTRLTSATDTTVQHRWYRGDRLDRAVDLRIRANPSNGYRTYSRYTMKAGSAGNWRVEVRSRDGVPLHEERFVVQ